MPPTYLSKVMHLRSEIRIFYGCSNMMHETLSAVVKYSEITKTASGYSTQIFFHSVYSALAGQSIEFLRKQQYDFQISTFPLDQEIGEYFPY